MTGTLLLLGWLLSLGAADPNMRDILQTVLLMVMVNFYLESSAIFQATNGEIPDGIARRFPPDKPIP